MARNPVFDMLKQKSTDNERSETAPVEEKVVPVSAPVEKRPRGERRPGRPDRSDIAIKDAVFVRCRVSVEENRRIKAYCLENGLSVDAFLRNVIFDKIK